MRILSKLPLWAGELLWTGELHWVGDNVESVLGQGHLLSSGPASRFSSLVLIHTSSAGKVDVVEKETGHTTLQI